MKKILSILLSSFIICSSAGCGAQSNSDAKAETTSSAEAATEAIPEATAATAASPLSKELKEFIEDQEFEGVIYATENGKPTVSYANGTLENGEKITLDTPMPIGSVSKQFCAASIMKLQEQGKLSVKDTLDKYFPEFKEGKKITLHNLLSMRSGLSELTGEEGVDVTNDNTEEENVAAIKKWLFNQPVTFEPDKAFVYTNINFFLLADIVEQQSGKKYIDFLRENFFIPLGMTHTGSIGELSDSPAWAQGITYKQVDLQPGLTKGAGDLISNAADMTAWISALSSGKVISEDSFKAMTTDYSPDGEHYGYGLYLELNGGVGHYGNIQIYSSFDYVNTEKNITLVTFTNSIDPAAISGLAADLLSEIVPQS